MRKCLGYMKSCISIIINLSNIVDFDDIVEDEESAQKIEEEDSA
jgi:hypothetical protein